MLQHNPVMKLITGIVFLTSCLHSHVTCQDISIPVFGDGAASSSGTPLFPNASLDVPSDVVTDDTSPAREFDTNFPPASPSTQSEAESAARQFLREYNEAARVDRSRVANAGFDYRTNITSESTARRLLEAEILSVQFDRAWREKAMTFDLDVLSEDTQRQLWLVKHIGIKAISPDKLRTQPNDSVSMETVYGMAQVCLDRDKCLDLEPDLTRIMATSRDYDQLLTVWKGWRDATGPKMRDTFLLYVNFSNEAVQSIGYSDTGKEWLSYYESERFDEDLLSLVEQVRPLYEHLHGYVRRRLKETYPADKFPASGHIPAHLLGNMWAQHWDNILDLVIPFPNKASMDITSAMVAQGYTATHMFRTAEDFYVSLGMEPMTETFWNKSMLEKPRDGRRVVCTPSSDDYYDKDGQDFRIKMCTDVTHTEFKTIHHEMGHIQYFMHYKDQPTVYRQGANPGFHEAVGDLMSLSFDTPEHLNKIGLLEKIPTDLETDINFLMRMALQKVAFLPFGYLIDQWRFSVFRGDTTPKTYNTDWWNLRCRYQGVSPPVPRSEIDFDPGSKYHVAANVEYTRYLVSYIIQFQFYKAACDATGYKGQLHRCDIYNNTVAGKLLGDMMKMGLSRPWPEAMRNITGQDKMDAGPLLEYFRPLLDYLRAHNGNDYGWHPKCPTDEDLNLEKKENAGDAGKPRNSGEIIRLSVTFVLVIVLVRMLL